MLPDQINVIESLAKLPIFYLHFTQLSNPVMIQKLLSRVNFCLNRNSDCISVIVKVFDLLVKGQQFEALKTYATELI